MPYTADRVYLMSRDTAIAKECGCVDLKAHTMKDRTGPTRRLNMQFWGERFYPVLESEKHLHDVVEGMA